MARLVITWAVAVWAMLAALPVHAVGQEIAQRKEAAVRTALEKQGKTGDFATLVASSARASAITEVSMHDALGAPEVTIQTDGRPAYEWFKLDGGKRIVIDFHNTIHLQSGLKLAPIGAAPLVRVRTSLFALEPEFVSRVVIDLRQAAHPEFSQEDGKVTMRLRKSESEEAAAFEKRATRYDTLIANAREAQEKAAEAERVELAKAVPTPIEAPAVTENVAGPQPANNGNVDSTIAKIERDLVSLRDADQEPAAPASAAIPVVVAAPTDSSASALAKLDGLSANMQHLAAMIETATASQPEDHAADMQTTTAVALNLASQPETVNAAPVVAAPADAAEGQADQSIVVAQAEASPEAQPSGTPTEQETPASDANTPEQPATPADSATPEQQPAPSEAPPTEAKADEPPAVVEEPKEPAQPPKIIAAAVPAEREALPPGVDPLDQIVNIDFREMDLSSVVSLLAKKGQVNVIAGTDVTGTVTADIRNVPLRKAMDMVLRMNGLGIVEEEGIFRVVPYEEAVAARRTTKLVPLTNAQAEDVRATLEGILVGGRDAKVISVAANKVTNVLIISGPEERAAELERVARELDVKLPVLPTVTEAIKLNYLDPLSAKPIAETLKTDKIGKIEIDKEGRHIVVTDVPAAVEQMKLLLASVDKPVKQVAIEALIVDAVLRDASQTGVDWTIEALRRHSSNGDLVSDVSQLQMDGNLGAVGTEALNAGVLQLGILSSEVRLNATIAAEVQSRNAQILASPSIVTVENQPATISIVQEFPYQEITQGLTGPPIASTEFKPIGVTLEVTPRITHTNDTIVDIEAKQSSVSGLTESGVPIEDKREARTTLRAQDGRTIFIGGLRNTSNVLNVSKIPVLGDIPVLNFMFRNTNAEKQNTELLIFLTCHVMDQELPDLTVTQQEEFDKLDTTPKVPDGQRANFHDILRPQDMRDPMWKWRRSNR